MFKVENIPNAAQLYRRISKWNYDKRRGKFSSSAFMLRKKESTLSVNWEKYSTPESSSLCPIKGDRYHVGAITAEIPRRECLNVTHSPVRHQAHTLISGARLTESNLEVAETLVEYCRPVFLL